MIPRTTIALLALAGLTLAACGSDEPDTTLAPLDDNASATLTVADLEGRTFVSSEVTGYDLVEGSEIDITFLADAMGVRGGCNSMNSEIQIDEGVLIAGPFASTMMACDQELMDQDTWLSEFLSGQPTIALDGATLTLADDATTITLDELPPSELVETTWLVTGTVANEAVSSTPVDSTASITIAPDGSVAVNAGCNTGSGSVEIGETTLVFGPIATTKKMCPPEQMDLETAVLAVLQGEVRYEIDGNTLSLRSGEGSDEIGLELTADS